MIIIGKKINMIGKRFNNLIVLCQSEEKDKTNHLKYLCKCDCGNITTVLGSSLRSGHTKSCGCLIFKHKKTYDRLYIIYSNMKARCYNQNNKYYKDYGGRGITICDEWLNDFMSFYNWSYENGYNETLTIDRIDNNKGYSPDNCRWTTPKQQANNRRNNIYLTYNDRTHTLTQWSEELGIHYNCLWKRHKLRWSDKECLFGRDV